MSIHLRKRDSADRKGAGCRTHPIPCSSSAQFICFPRMYTGRSREPHFQRWGDDTSSGMRVAEFRRRLRIFPTKVPLRRYAYGPWFSRFSFNDDSFDENSSINLGMNSHPCLQGRMLCANAPLALFDQTQLGPASTYPPLNEPTAEISMEPVRLKVLIEIIQDIFFQPKWRSLRSRRCFFTVKPLV